MRILMKAGGNHHPGGWKFCPNGAQYTVVDLVHLENGINAASHIPLRVAVWPAITLRGEKIMMLDMCSGIQKQRREIRRSVSYQRHEHVVQQQIKQHRPAPRSRPARHDQ